MTTTDEFAAALNFVASGRLAEVEAHLASRTGVVLRVDGADVRDAASFLRRAGEALTGAPMQNWAQFEDVLRSAVFRAEGSEYALLWTEVDRMLDGGLDDLVTVTDACLGLARTRQEHGHRVRAFFLGDGPNFK